MTNNSSLTPNVLAFLALCNEYCSAIENASSTEREEFVASMTRILPRIYIAASDLRTDDETMSLDPEEEEGYINPVLDEDGYETIKQGVEALLGADDTYLEVFEEDMKYSDTPIGASVSEGLTDIFQSLYNLVENIKESPDYLIGSSLRAAKADFEAYWSRILCNVMRPLNALRYSTDSDNEY